MNCLNSLLVTSYRSIQQSGVSTAGTCSNPATSTVTRAPGILTMPAGTFSSLSSTKLVFLQNSGGKRPDHGSLLEAASTVRKPCFFICQRVEPRGILSRGIGVRPAYSQLPEFAK